MRDIICSKIPWVQIFVWKCSVLFWGKNVWATLIPDAHVATQSIDNQFYKENQRHVLTLWPGMVEFMKLKLRCAFLTLFILERRLSSGLRSPATAIPSGKQGHPTRILRHHHLYSTDFTFTWRHPLSLLIAPGSSSSLCSVLLLLFRLCIYI